MAPYSSWARTAPNRPGRGRFSICHSDKPGFVVGRQDPSEPVYILGNRVTGHQVPIDQARQEHVDEKLDARGAIEQFMDGHVLELLLHDSVEAEPQLDIDDGRDAIECQDHE
jgi:hypothetical protein